MKFERMTEGFARFGRMVEGSAAMLAVVIFAIATIAPVTAASAAISPLDIGTQMLIPTSQPTMYYNDSIPYMVVTFQNQLTVPVNGTLYGVVRNLQNQTVYIASSPIPMLNASQSANVRLYLPLSLDTYRVSYFVVSSSFYAISPTNIASAII